MATCPHCGKEIKITLTLEGGNNYSQPLNSPPKPVTPRPTHSPSLQTQASSLFSLMAQGKKDEIAKLTRMKR